MRREILDWPGLCVRSALGLFFLQTIVLGCSTDTTGDKEPVTRIFATVSKTGQVLVLDDDTHEVLSTIGVGQGPAIILSTPDQKKLFTANWADNTVSAIDVATEQVTSIPMRGRPYVIAMAPDGKYLYAGLYTVNEIAVINTQTHVVEQAFKTEALPASIIVSPDGATLYVAKLASGLIPTGNGSLEALSASTGAVQKEKLEVGGTPAWITIGRDGKKVYSLNFTTDDVTVVDTASWTVTATIETGPGTQGIIGNVTPDGSRLYVTNHGTSNMIAIDTNTNAIVQTIELGGKPVGVSFDAEGRHVYVTDFGPSSKDEPITNGLTYLLTGVYTSTGDGTVSVFDVASGAPVGKAVTTPPGPTSVVVLPPQVAAK